MTSVRRSAVDIETTPLVLVMVGLPARGKTYMSRKLARYLRWQGYRARVFNVGTYRRERLGTGQAARCFDPDNVDGVNDRTRMALQALALRQPREVELAHRLTRRLLDASLTQMKDSARRTRSEEALDHAYQRFLEDLT